MVRVEYSRSAVIQLETLYAYIAQNSSPDTAYRFVQSIISYCEGFQTFPRRGIKRDDIRPGLRLVGFRRMATIAFTVRDEVVTILGIFHGGQNVDEILRLGSDHT